MRENPVSIAHFSDLHYGEATLAEADRCFVAAIERAAAERVDFAVISGDATDHGLDLHAPAALRLLSRVRQLADHCPVLMLQGTYSHEPPGTLAVFRLLGARHPVHVADRIGQVALTQDGRWVASEGWHFARIVPGARVLLSCVPTVNKAQVAIAAGARDAAQAAGEHLAALLAGFAPLNRQARQQGLPTALVAHGALFGSLSEHGVPMAGFDHEFSEGAIFAAEARAAMLGRIHRHQQWVRTEEGGEQRIAYAGSIGRFHYGEEGDKGFLIWRVEADHADCALMSTPARQTVDIVFEGKPDLAALRAAIDAHRVAGAHVRVRWTVADEDRHRVDRAAITRLLAGAADIRLEGRIVPIVMARAPGIARLDSLAGKVRVWAQLTGVEPACVLACLESLQQDAPTRIAERVLCDKASVASSVP
ncbi:MAG: metallophosphatase family protein [Azoarcus sp.]|jgi:exonuclease SbcD|nr:metallophosphatase family protein [Azoarcus sp.]